MASWVDIPLTTGCSPPTIVGTVKLPQDSPDVVAARVLIKAGNKQRLLKVDYRNDSGQGACLSERDHRAIGKSPTGKYRTVTKLEALRLDPTLRLALGTAIVTFISDVLGIVLTLLKATASTGTSGPSTAAIATAAVVAVLAFIIAALKLNSDLSQV